jgi:hypothetical protein
VKTSKTRKIKTRKQITYQQFMAARNQAPLFDNLPATVPPLKIDPYLGTEQDWQTLEKLSHLAFPRPCYFARLVAMTPAGAVNSHVYLHVPNRQAALEWLAQHRPNEQLHFLAPLASVMTVPPPDCDLSITDPLVQSVGEHFRNYYGSVNSRSS